MFGDTLVIPNLNLPAWDLNFDEQTRCLSHLIKHLSDFCDLPQGLKARLTAVEYLGGPYPGISLYVMDEVEIDVKSIPSPLFLEAKLNAYIQEVGKQRLLALANKETVTWQNVLAGAATS